MRTLLLIGTRKGGFIAESDASRRTWTLTGPLLKGCEVNHVALGNGRLAMTGKSWVVGARAAVVWTMPAHGGANPRPASASRKAAAFSRTDLVRESRSAGRRPPLRGVESGSPVSATSRGGSVARGPGAHGPSNAGEMGPRCGRPDGHSMCSSPSQPSRLTVGVSAPALSIR